MSMKILQAQSEHEVAYQDLVALVRKHADKLTAEELLAVAANMLGKLIALQDQRTMTRDRALQIIMVNMESGNQGVVAALRDDVAGSA